MLGMVEQGGNACGILGLLCLTAPHKIFEYGSRFIYSQSRTKGLHNRELAFLPVFLDSQTLIAHTPSFDIASAFRTAVCVFVLFFCLKYITSQYALLLPLNLGICPSDGLTRYILILHVALFFFLSLSSIIDYNYLDYRLISYLSFMFSPLKSLGQKTLMPNKKL